MRGSSSFVHLWHLESRISMNKLELMFLNSMKNSLLHEIEKIDHLIGELQFMAHSLRLMAENITRILNGDNSLINDISIITLNNTTQRSIVNSPAANLQPALCSTSIHSNKKHDLGIGWLTNESFENNISQSQLKQNVSLRMPRNSSKILYDGTTGGGENNIELARGVENLKISCEDLNGPNLNPVFEQEDNLLLPHTPNQRRRTGFVEFEDFRSPEPERNEPQKPKGRKVWQKNQDKPTIGSKVMVAENKTAKKTKQNDVGAEKKNVRQSKRIKKAPK